MTLLLSMQNGDVHRLHDSPYVLIVEDDADLAEAIRCVVEFQGIGTHVATNGSAALWFLETCEQTPSLILLDLMMPVMDGFEFLRRCPVRLADVPVVVRTAGKLDGLPKSVRGFRKPVSMDVVVGELRPCWSNAKCG